VAAARIELWKLLNCPCGQRRVPLRREQGPRLRQRGFWHCPEEVAARLVRISAKTADRRLAPERRRLHLDQRRGRSLRCRLGEQIPVKMAEEWDRRQGGQPASGLGAPLWPVDRGPFPGDAVHGGHRHPLVGGRAGDGSQGSAVEGRGRRTIGAGSSRRTGPACASWWATTG
jgi:hypothetical protein